MLRFPHTFHNAAIIFSVKDKSTLSLVLIEKQFPLPLPLLLSTHISPHDGFACMSDYSP
jgi:hypothetical protein